MGEPFTIRRCVHYVSRLDTCKAGVTVERLVDSEDRIPCVTIRGITGSLTCDELEMELFPAPAKQGVLASALAAITKGLCPTCSDPIRGEVEIDGAIRAMPCRHVLRTHKPEPKVGPPPRAYTAPEQPKPRQKRRHLKLVP